MDEELYLQRICESPDSTNIRREYGHWLSQHDPARGAFVLSELAWQEETTLAEDRLKQLTLDASQFDPVWVARFARPPLGIHRDHLTFSGNRPQITAAALQYLEGLLGGQLPAQYRAFLLNHNGGVPSLKHFVLPDGQVREVGYLLSIFSPMGEPVDLDIDLVGFAQVQFVGGFPPLPDDCKPGIGLPDDLIKIGYCEITGFGDTLCLGFKGPRRGQVWLLDPCTLPSEEKIEQLVTPSFAEFLRRLSVCP